MWFGATKMPKRRKSLRTKPEDLDLATKTHTAEGQNQPPQVILQVLCRYLDGYISI